LALVTSRAEILIEVEHAVTCRQVTGDLISITEDPCEGMLQSISLRSSEESIIGHRTG
jgi:hypothetical protein